jgi:hypothetical protein
LSLRHISSHQQSSLQSSQSSVHLLVQDCTSAALVHQQVQAAAAGSK